MKNLSVLLLLTLVLLPIIWNGAGFFHYVIEHTHTFCENDSDHGHASTHECFDIYHLTQNQDHKQLLSKIEFFELYQFITTSSFSGSNTLLFTSSTSKGESPFLYGRMLSDDIFRPPII